MGLTPENLLVLWIGFSFSKKDYLKGEQPCFGLCRKNRSSTFCSHRLAPTMQSHFCFKLFLLGCFTPSHPPVQARCPRDNPDRNFCLLLKSKRSTLREINCISQVIDKSSSFLMVPSSYLLELPELIREKKNPYTATQ